MTRAPGSAAQPISLSQRVLRAGAWTLVGHTASQAVRLVSNLLMTRLLAPDLFGVMAVALTFVMALEMLSDVGLRQVVIQHREDNDSDLLNTVWTVQLIRGVVLAIFGAALALGLSILQAVGSLMPPSAYGHPGLPVALAIIALSSLFNGFASTQLLTASRSLQLARVTLIDLLAQITAMAVMVLWAWRSPSIVAIAIGIVAGTVLRCVLSHTIIPGYQNRLCWSVPHVREIFGFGKWVIWTSMLGFALNSADTWILGAMLPASEFGVYTIAVLIVGTVTGLGQKLLAAVVHPAFSHAQRSSPAGLCDVYYRFRLPVDVLSCGLAGLLVASAPALIRALYDPRYEGAGQAIQVLALPLLLMGAGLAATVYMVVGKPSLMVWPMAIRLVAVVIAIPALTSHYGMLGGAAGVVVGHACSVPAIYVLKARLGLMKLRRELIGPLFFLAGMLCGYVLNSLYI